MSDEQLKSCPFCGGEAASFFHRDRGMGDSWHVECIAEPCGCGTCHHDTQTEAITAWNRRASLTEQTPSDGLAGELVAKVNARLRQHFGPCGDRGLGQDLEDMILTALSRPDAATVERDAVIEQCAKIARDYAAKAKLRGWMTGPDSIAQAASHIAKAIRALRSGAGA